MYKTAGVLLQSFHWIQQRSVSVEGDENPSGCQRKYRGVPLLAQRGAVRHVPEALHLTHRQVVAVRHLARARPPWKRRIAYVMRKLGQGPRKCGTKRSSSLKCLWECQRDRKDTPKIADHPMKDQPKQIQKNKKEVEMACHTQPTCSWQKHLCPASSAPTNKLIGFGRSDLEVPCAAR